jgi:hypothetical protein
MPVDTARKHYKCTKCHDVKEDMNPKNKIICSTGGYCNLKIKQTSWERSALGITVNLIGRGVRVVGKKAGEYITSKRKN